jgi:hypothetical protein
MTEIVFVFEGRIGFWSRIWMTNWDLPSC